jgi:hypothetical protein
MKQLEAIERALAQPMWFGEPGEEEPTPPDEPAGSVGWRGVCKSHISLDRNWRYGRCRERYLTPPGNSVWRIKVDPEDDVLFATDRTGEYIYKNDRAEADTKGVSLSLIQRPLKLSLR